MLPERAANLPVMPERVHDPSQTPSVRFRHRDDHLCARHKQGIRVRATVEKTIKREIPVPYEMLHLVLSDGRALFVSPLHPLIDGRLAGSLAVGSLVDNAPVREAGSLPYNEGATYDILPSGDTGFYWANGILLASTLKPTQPGQR